MSVAMSKSAQKKTDAPRFAPGKGVSQVQRESRAAYDALREVVDLAQDCYNKWEEKNRLSSVHRHFTEFDPLLPKGKLALRALFCMMRGGKASWVFSIINQIIFTEGMPAIVIPYHERGRLGKITDRYLKYANEHFPPTAIELHWSAMFAEEKANEFWGYVTVPDLGTAYGGTYFSGSLEQAVAYNAMAAELRRLCREKLLSQQDQWKD